MTLKINSQSNIDAMLATLRQHQIDSTGRTTPGVLTPPCQKLASRRSAKRLSQR